ncbi:hypothetical protein ACFLRO_00875 [Bacteroidota bacterium]
MPARGLFLSIVVLVISLSGCSLFDGRLGGRTDVYVGQMSFGFEEAAFRPCNTREQWWITGGDVVGELQSRYNDLGVAWYEPVYAKLKGDKSGKGEYGHLGAYEREFDVSDVIEIRLLEQGECPR